MLKGTFMAPSLAFSDFLSILLAISALVTIASSAPLPQIPTQGTPFSGSHENYHVPATEPSRIIPSLPDAASITIFVFIGLIGLLVPSLLLNHLRRRRINNEISPLVNSNTNNSTNNNTSRPSSRLTFMTRSRGNSNATYSTYTTFKSSRLSTISMDSFRDEVKRPERVLSFKRPWERDKEMDLYIVEDEDGPRRKPTIRSTTRYPNIDALTGAGLELNRRENMVEDYAPANWPLRN